MYRCPLCHQPLNRQDLSWRCANAHCFDIAKEGYVNLLPVQNKHSKNPGDNAQMMQARRAFLDAGYYQPLSDQINQLLSQHLTASAKLLDLGCGEGYYTARLSDALNAKQAQIWGLDISKTAIRYAAKRYSAINFSVASAYDLPFADQSFDAITRIYAPSLSTEIERVLKHQAWLLTVQPAARHLFELKQAIYQTPRLHEDLAENLPGLVLRQQQNLSYAIELKQPQDTLNLLNMTPFAWKLTEAHKLQLTERLSKVSLDFTIRLYQKPIP